MSYADQIRAKHEAIVSKYGKKLATVTAKSVEVLEIGAGAAVAGVIQGRAIAQGHMEGARILGLPADLMLGVGLELAGHFDLAGEEWSHHLCNFGAGFIAGYASDWGVAFGKRWVSEGHLPLLESKPTPALSKGEVTPEQMASVLSDRLHAPAR
jgi:hypothetical protein